MPQKKYLVTLSAQGPTMAVQHALLDEGLDGQMEISPLRGQVVLERPLPPKATKKSRKAKKRTHLAPVTPLRRPEDPL
jgi:hypothetical protein